MALPGCKLLLLVEPPTAYFKIVGRAAVERAADFKRTVLRLESEGVSKFCLDLSQCLLMDSTFAGVLGGLADTLGGTPTGAPRVAIFGANERVRDLLDNLDVLSKVREIADPNVRQLESDAEDVAKTSDRSETTICCLEAHRYLMALKPENEMKFRELTRVLESQISPAGRPD